MSKSKPSPPGLVGKLESRGKGAKLRNLSIGETAVDKFIFVLGPSKFFLSVIDKNTK